MAGFTHSAIGFGFGIVAVTLLPLLIDAKEAHIAISVASVPVIVAAAWSYRKGLELADLRNALVGAAVGLPAGLLLFHWLPIDWLIRATGLAILVMIWIRFRNRSLKTPHAIQRNRGECVLAGALAGFLAGAVSIAGPPVAAFALKQGWDQARFKAFVNQFLLLVAIYKVLAMGASGLLHVSVIVKAAWLAPAAIIGILVGAKVSRRFSSLWFERSVTLVLIVIAALFIIRGGGSP